MARLKRKTRRIKNLPASNANIIAIGLGIVELVVLWLSVYRVFGEVDFLNKAFASFGTFCIIASFINLILSFKGLFLHEYGILYRIAALILSLACLVIWTSIYMVGWTGLLK